MYTPGGEKPAVGKARAYGSPIREGVEKVMVIPWFIKEGTRSNRQHGRFSSSIPGRVMSVQQRLYKYQLLWTRMIRMTC